MRILKCNKTRGFTLVELMIVVAIVGVLATLAVYGVLRYFENAKTAEAKNAIGRISKAAVTAYQQEKATNEKLKVGAAYVAKSNALCKSSSKVPSDAKGGVPKGQKYQSAEADWDGTADTGWRCLKFSLTGPQYYQYQYVTDQDVDATMFAAGAIGDLNGTGLADSYTSLKILGKLEDGTHNIILSPSIIETTASEVNVTEPGSP